MNEVKKEKWLSDMFSNSLRNSVKEMIQDREHKVRRVLYEIFNITEDFRSERVGGFLTAILLWRVV